MTATTVLLWLLATTPSSANSTLNQGWGCRDCGYLNGPELSGLRSTAAFAASAGSQGTGATVTLRSGKIISLQ
jgi:hypothetical protein